MQRRVILLVALLAAVPVVAPVAQAQVPDAYYSVEAEVEALAVEMDRNDAVSLRLEIRDTSVYQRTGTTGAAPIYHRVEVDTRVEASGNQTPRGWAAGVSPPSQQIQAGGSTNVTLSIFTLTRNEPNQVRIVVNVTMHAGGGEYHTGLQVMAFQEATRAVSAQIIAAPPEVAPNGMTTYPISVVNGGNYPDTFRVRFSGLEDLDASTVTSFSLAPLEQQTVHVTFIGPSKMFQLTPKTEVVRVTFESQNNPEAQFTVPVPVTVKGYWIPTWLYPLMTVFLALAVFGGHRTYRKIQDDRERYGHPGPRYTKQQKRKLKQLKKRDKQKYKVVKDRVKEKHKEEMRAYKERKKKGKAREPRKLAKKIRKKQKREDKLRRKAINRVAKDKKKGRPPRKILERLDDEQKAQIEDELPEMLAAATAAGAIAAARDEEERGFLEERRARKAVHKNRRLRAEAVALVEHLQSKGREPDEIEDELSEPHRRALGSDLEEALQGDLDVDPEETIEELPFWERRKGRSFLGDLRKEKQKLRSKALKTIQKGKKKDRSKKEILERLSSEQIHLVGDLLPEMLATHLPEEAELVLLDPSRDLTKKEERRRRKLQEKVQDKRIQEMQDAAETIEKLHEKGEPREAILDELTSAQRWAAGDMLDVLLEPLPEAIAGLRAALEDEDLDEEDREVWEAHLEELESRKLKFVERGVKHVDKLRSKGEDPETILAELDPMEREALSGALPSLLKATLSAEIAGLEDHLEEATLSEEERAFWEERLEERREDRRTRAVEAKETIQSALDDAEPPEAIADELSPADLDAVGPVVEKMLQATFPEDVEVLHQVHRSDRDPDELKDAREAAKKTRRKARDAAVKQIRKAKKKDREPEAIAEELSETDWAVLGDAAERMLEAPLPEDVVLIDEMTRPDADTDAVRDAKEDAKKARDKARRKAKKRADKAYDKGASWEEAVASRSYRDRKLLESVEPPEDREEPESGSGGGLLPFGSPGDGEEAADEAESDEPEESSGGLLSGLFSSGGGDWKQELAQDLLEADVPSDRVTRILKMTERKVEGLPDEERRKVVEKVRERVLGEE